MGIFQLFLPRIKPIIFPFSLLLFRANSSFLGDIGAFTKTVLALIILATAIKITLWLLQPLSTDFISNLNSASTTNRLERWLLKGRKLAEKLHQ